jgi:hypothetical protein
VKLSLALIQLSWQERRLRDFLQAMEPHDQRTYFGTTEAVPSSEALMGRLLVFGWCGEQFGWIDCGLAPE